METWEKLLAEDNLFELSLPPGVKLIEDETVPASETYLYWSSPEKNGTFSICRQPSPGPTAESLLALERELGARVTIEADEIANRSGRSAHHLKYRLEETRPRETIEDPVTGVLSHLPSRQVKRKAEYIIWQGDRETIRTGYRVDAGANPDLIATFQRMLESFHLLRSF